MSDDKTQARVLILMAVLALWAAAWVYSVVFALSAPATGDGFVRGLNRVTGFLGWQGVAALFAVAAFGIGRGLPKGSGSRQISAVPLGMALAMVAVVLGVVVYAGY